MDLREYLFRKRMKPKEIARKINYNANYVQAIAEGRKRPGKKCAILVEMATNGEVTAHEIMNQEIWIPKK